MKRFVFLATVLVVVAIASTPASAFYVKVIESRLTGGANNPLCTISGPSTSSGKSTAGPLSGWTGGNLTGTGSFYAGDTTPIKYIEYAYLPSASKGGYYDVYATWQNVTSAQNVNPIFTVKNAGTTVSVAKDQTIGGNTWNSLATGLLFNASTSYKTKEATIGTNASGMRASFDSIAWAASEAGAITNTGYANGASVTLGSNELHWAGGASTMFYNVYFGTTSGALSLLQGNLPAGTGVRDLEGLLQGRTQYFWRVDSGNIDRITTGTEFTFTTAAPVPEPGSMLALGTGLIGLFGIIRRRTA